METSATGGTFSAIYTSVKTDRNIRSTIQEWSDGQGNYYLTIINENIGSYSIDLDWADTYRLENITSSKLAGAYRMLLLPAYAVTNMRKTPDITLTEVNRHVIWIDFTFNDLGVTDCYLRDTASSNTTVSGLGWYQRNDSFGVPFTIRYPS